MWQRIKNIYHLGVAILNNLFFWFPGKKLIVVGVTGTDGKTTTVNLIYHILKESGKKVSMLDSIGAYVGGKEYETGHHVTTPSSFFLQKLLRKAVSVKSKYFVLEVTSHAIDQYRIWGIPFKVGVLTNITSEHLDYHKTYDNYVKTKEKLLSMADIAVVNRDDGSYTLLPEAKNKTQNKKWITYGFSESADLNIKNFNFESEALIGDFNKYNALAATASAKSLGISTQEIKKALRTFTMPLGRIDFVHKDKFSVVIDFAHTSNAFEQLLSALKPKAKGRIIHVFGSAGERDATKRPFMGEISSKYSEIIILTSEDPRSEDVGKIMNEIESGIKNKDASVFKIPDRKEAIDAGIQMAQEGDLVLITGKAHEKSLNVGGNETKWDEYQAVRDAISGRK